jgi:N4-gp56 family major capsid protein
MPFTTNLSGTTQVDNSIIDLMDAQFIVASAQEQVMDQFVTYKASIGAKSIEFPKYAQLALSTTPLTEDEDVTSEAMSDSQIILTPAEYGKVVTTTKLASLQSGGKADLAASRLVGLNAGRTLDKLAILALEASSNAVTVDGGAEAALTAGDVMTVSFLNALYNKLARASIMPLSEGMFVAVMHDDILHDLRSSAGTGGWQDVNKYSRPETVLMNEVGMLCGFRIVRDNNITISADAGDAAVDTYRTLCFGFNALGKAVSKEVSPTLTGPFDKLGRFVNFGWHGALQYKIVDQDALWVGITASSVGSN